MDAPARLLAIFTNSFFSFLNAGIFLFEFYLVLKFVKELKVEAYFNRVTGLVRFILALIVTSFAFPAINSSISKYLTGVLGSGAPLAKLLVLVEAALFSFVIYKLYKGASANEK